MIINILLSLLVLNIMVIAHELGHYLLARKNKIGVHEFAIGFGPTLLKKEAFGTIWMVKAFPLGGYNGLKGEMETEEGFGNFSTARKKAKIEVLVAGSLMNVLLAVVAFYIALGLYGWKVPVPMDFNPVGAVVTSIGEEHPVVSGIAENSPMSKLGVTVPFTILSVNGKLVKTPQNVIDEIMNSPSEVISMQVESDQKPSTIIVTRAADKKIGIIIGSAPIQLDYGTKIQHKIFAGFSHAVNMTALTGKMLGAMISFTAKTGDLEPIGYAFAGPVAIVAAVGSVVKDSKTVFADLANMTGLIGISLAMFNMLPFPGLDGWHIFLIFYEKVRGKKPNQKLVNIITAIGLFFLLGLGVIIMFKDVWLFFLKR